MKNDKRYLESMSPLIDEKLHKENRILWLSSPSDIGVRRNQGRNGTRFAPRSIMNVFKKLNNHTPVKDHYIGHVNVSDQTLESENFHDAQVISSNNIHQQLKNFQGNQIIHIGGGHDHAYPMLCALEKSGIEEVIILNVDAHCDTRVDAIRHSGTPFRDFTNESKIKVRLYQYGIHRYANSPSTMSDLKNSQMHIVYRHQSQGHLNFLDADINWNNPKLAVYFSLDTDALDGSLFEGVSAVNGNGLELSHVKQLMLDFFHKSKKAKKVLGIYEYNPVYDNLSQKGARAIASLIYDFVLDN
jgi:formiminoglutamase